MGIFSIDENISNMKVEDLYKILSKEQKNELFKKIVISMKGNEILETLGCQQKLDIYYAVDHDFQIEDAKAVINDLYGKDNSEVVNFCLKHIEEIISSWEYDYHDCTLADYDTWRDCIENFVDENIDKEEC